MNVWPGCGTRNRGAKRRVRNSVPLQKVEQRAAFDTVRMKLNIHCVVMVQPPAIVNRSLSEDGDRKLLMKRVGKESLNPPGIAQIPIAGAGVTRESGRSNQRLPGEAQVLRDLFVGCGFDEHARNLRV